MLNGFKACVNKIKLQQWGVGFIPVGDPRWIFPALYLFEDTDVFSMHSIRVCCSVPKPFIQIQTTNKRAGRPVSRLHAAGQ